MAIGNQSTKWILSSAIALAGVALPSTTLAANYYLHANLTSSTPTWESGEVWFDDPVAGNTLATNGDSLSGNTFFSNGFDVRTGTGNVTFGNATTTLNLDDSFILRTGPSNGSNLPGTLNTTSGTPRINAGTADVRMTIGTWNNAITTRISMEFSDRRMSLTIGDLNGAGNLSLTGGAEFSDTDDTRGLRLSVTDASDFTGNIVWGDGNSTVLEFTNALSSGGGLIVPSTGRIVLNQDVTFASVSIAGTPLAGGTHSYASLNALFDEVFLEGGSGSITVVPEPASIGLAMGAAGLMMLRRRRQA